MSKITRILSVDLGNYNTKTSNKVIFESRFKKVGIAEEVFGVDYLILEDEKFLIEQGAWDLDYDKTLKNYKPCLLAAIAKSYGKTVKTIDGIGLVLGLPLTQLKNKDKLINDLQGKQFEINYNGVKKVIGIEKVAVVGEGFSSVYTLSESERNDDILLVDLGGRTANIVDYSSGAVEDTGTIPSGLYDFYEEVQAKLLSDTDIKIEKVRNLVDKKKVDEDKVKEIKVNFINELANNLKPYNPQFKQLWFTGGGSATLKEEIKDKYTDAKFVMMFYLVMF